uniref:Uncharacterized protein n=1 Tax=Arundo donax TaxID=35708 RepID=A0A0A9AS93_ARUDO
MQILLSDIQGDVYIPRDSSRLGSMWMQGDTKEPMTTKISLDCQRIHQSSTGGCGDALLHS